MSTDITDYSNKDKEEQSEENSMAKVDYKRISLTFVDSIFTQINPKIEVKDPLNSNAKEFYSRQPKKEIPLPEKTPEKESPSQIEISENKETLINDSDVGKKNKETTKEKAKENIPKSTANKKKNYNNSYKQKILMNTTSSKNTNKNKSNNTEMKNKNNSKPINTKVNIRNLNQNSKTYSSINENFKAKIESDKEKKLYQEKVRLLENRILALKKHEDIIHRRMHYNDVRQTYLNQCKKEKSDMKQALLSHDIDKRNELDLKRKHIKEQKSSLDKHLKESMEKSKITKMKDYENMQKEKKLALSIINENNNKFEQYGRGNVNKIKKEREQIKKNETKKFQNMEKSADNFYLETCEDNKNETNKLKNKLKKLEKLEIKYINSLNKTRQGLLRNNSQGFYLNKKEMVPITRLNLDKQMDKPFSGKDKTKTMYKRNHKNTVSVDNLKNHIKNDDQDKDAEIDEDKKSNKDIKEDKKDKID